MNLIKTKIENSWATNECFGLLDVISREIRTGEKLATLDLSVGENKVFDTFDLLYANLERVFLDELRRKVGVEV